MICLDTSILIWGIQGQATPGQERMIVQARSYMQMLSGRGVRMMIPTPALTEYLSGLPAEDQPQQLKVIESVFVLPSFDIPSAELAAEMSSDRELNRRIRSEHNVGRQCLRVDTQIIATAVVHGATQIVTDDVAHFKALARGRIPILALRPVETQNQLF